MLSTFEQREHLLIHTAAEVALERRRRGVKLNPPGTEVNADTRRVRSHGKRVTHRPVEELPVARRPFLY